MEKNEGGAIKKVTTLRQPMLSILQLHLDVISLFQKHFPFFPSHPILFLVLLFFLSSVSTARIYHG